MLRVIREIKPSYIVGENVAGLLSWSGGLVFDEVHSDLEAEGYEVQAVVIPAAAVNAPHGRDRVWFVAHANINTTRSSGTSGSIEASRSGYNDEQNKWRGETEFNNRSSSFSWDASDTCNERLERSEIIRGVRGCGQKSDKQPTGRIFSSWENFPTVSPVRMRNDGVSDKLLRFVVNEFYDTISYTSQENRIENLQEVWEKIQSEEIWEKIRRLYTLESKIVLFQTMQLYSSKWNKQRELSPFSKEFCKQILQHLSKYGEFRCSPQGQELEKQRNIQFNHSLSFLPHEIALAARRFETAITKFETWHRKESIKAAGNAVVPQVVYEIFKAIEVTRK